MRGYPKGYAVWLIEDELGQYSVLLVKLLAPKASARPTQAEIKRHGKTDGAGLAVEVGNAAFVCLRCTSPQVARTSPAVASLEGLLIEVLRTISTGGRIAAHADETFPGYAR